MTGAGMALVSAAEASNSNHVWTIVVWVVAGLSFVATGIGMKIWR